MPHPGILYGCENKGVARKGICKSMNAKGDGKWRVTSDEWRERTRDTPTPVFLQKSVQAVENKGRELQKEGQERSKSAQQYEKT
jgi:hypothetical protein